jgi:hypothetical protein
MLAMEKHNFAQTWDVSKESPDHIAARWTLPCFSKLLCISIAMRVTKVCAREGRVVEPMLCFSFAMVIVPSFTVMGREMHSIFISTSMAMGRS